MPLQSCSKPWRDLVVREDTSSSNHNFTGNNFLETSKLISLKVDLLFKVSLIEEYSVRQWWQCKPEVESGKDRRWSDAHSPPTQPECWRWSFIAPHTARMLRQVICLHGILTLVGLQFTCQACLLVGHHVIAKTFIWKVNNTYTSMNVKN